VFYIENMKAPKKWKYFWIESYFRQVCWVEKYQKLSKKIVIHPTLFYGKEIINQDAYLDTQNVSNFIYKTDVWDNTTTTLNLKNENTLITYEKKTKHNSPNSVA
jgi:predicted nucleic acid-binding protein